MECDGVIFDLDGTLIASEAVYLRAWRSAAKELGEEMTDELYHRLIGMNRADTIAELGKLWSASLRAEGFIDLSQRHYEKLVADEGHRVRPGIPELLERLAALRLPLAVATSSHRRLAEETLAATGLKKCFRALAAGDEVSCGKPDPEIYLLAAGRLGVAPARCVAFEDTPTGAEAAFAAGMIVVLIPELSRRSTGHARSVLTFPDHRAALALFGDPG